MTHKKYHYSEIFFSLQGEGNYTGFPTAWIRFYLCNLQCDGFGQKDPTDPSTYVLPYQTFDVSSVKRVEDLPVWEYGCDSSYTWSKKFKHLMQKDTAFEICNSLEDVIRHPSNPGGRFLHPKTHRRTHMAFTGGEPMLNQEAMVDILNQFWIRDNFPYDVTIETNGTKPLKDEFDDCIQQLVADSNWGLKVFWSVSPKLWSTAGEKPEKAIKPEVVAGYSNLPNCGGQLKYVVNGSDESWDEVERYTAMYRNEGVEFPVWIMYVGATKEEQEDDRIADVAIEAMKRGYRFSGRLHVHLMGNRIGT